jgi:diaminohydroxyphosphoribosylaminopyrimidine deaminase/5-amino-6-(5-phosphoribosylamino)uracil reductase
VLADDPLLTVRLGRRGAEWPPLRVVLDVGLATPARARVRMTSAPTLYLHARVKPRRVSPIRDRVAVPNATAASIWTPCCALARAASTRSSWKPVRPWPGPSCGGLVDELLLYVAPVLLGERARPLFHGLHIDAMAQRLRLRVVDTPQVGEDLRVLLRPQGGS